MVPSLPRALVDTNVLVYAYDPTDLTKHGVARALLRDLSDSGILTFTAQVFNEFSSVLTGFRRGRRRTPAEVYSILREVTALGDVLPLAAPLTFRALAAMGSYQMSFWDALLLASARENGITLIYTEDLQSALEIEGVRYINPFA